MRSASKGRGRLALYTIRSVFQTFGNLDAPEEWTAMFDLKSLFAISDVLFQCGERDAD